MWGEIREAERCWERLGNWRGWGEIRKLEGCGGD